MERSLKDLAILFLENQEDPNLNNELISSLIRKNVLPSYPEENLKLRTKLASLQDIVRNYVTHTIELFSQEEDGLTALLDDLEEISPEIVENFLNSGFLSTLREVVVEQGFSEDLSLLIYDACMEEPLDLRDLSQKISTKLWELKK